MRTKTMKFWMCLALAVCMLVGMVPFGAFAATNEFSITGINAYNFRGSDWYIILSTDNADFSLSAAASLNAAGATIDGAAAGGWFQPGAGTLAFTLATDKASHKVVFPAGMVLGGYTLKEDFVFFTQADGSVKAGVSVTGINAYNFRVNDWYIILNTDNADFSLSTATSLTAAGATIDGAAASGWFQPGTGTLAFTLATDKADHKVVIPQGTVLGNYVLAEDYVFCTYADGAVGPATFNITGFQAFNFRGNDWYIILTIDNAKFNLPAVASLTTAGVTIDGAAAAGWFQIGTGTLAFTLATGKEEHKIVLPAGMQLGDYVLENQYVFYTHDTGRVDNIAPMSITGISGYRFRGNDWYIVLNTSDSAFALSSVASLETAGVTVDGAATTGWFQANADMGESSGKLAFTLGVDQAEHKVVIPAGTMLGNYKLTSDYTFYTHADGTVSDKAPAVNITGIQAYNFRGSDWYIILNVDNAAFTMAEVASLANTGITVDGAATTGWIQKTTGTLEFSLGTDKAEHTVVIPAGTVLGDYVLENEFVFYTHADGVVNAIEPVKLVNITGIQAYNFRGSDWYIILNVDDAAFTMAEVASLATSGITVDGAATTGWIQKTTGTLEFSLGTDKADHTVVIPAGTVLGGYVLENEFVFYTHANGAVNTIVPVKQVSITGIQAYNFRGSDWYIILNVDDAAFAMENVASLATSGITVDGAATTGWIQKTTGTLEFSLGTDKANHEVIIPAGTKLGDYIVKEDFVFYTHSNGAVNTEEPMGVEGWSMTLSDNLDMNFFVSVTENNLANTCVQISVGSETVQFAPETVDEATGYYKFSVELAAAQMTETVTYTLLLGEDVIESKTYTVRQYADTILEGEYDEATKNLVRSMLHYGAAAQVYFDYLPENPANAQLDAPVNAPIPEQAETPMSIDGSIADVRFYGASLLFRSETAVRFYFEASAIDGCTFAVNGEGYAAQKAENGLYYVEIDGINPQELAESFTLTVANGEETLTIVYGPMNYIVRMGASSSAELQELLLAMYNYHLAAVNFFVTAL